MRVLIVDDDGIGAELMATYATACGHHVDACVSSADEAWRVTQRMPIDLLIADVDLGAAPGLDGIGLATMMRERLGLRTVFVTGQSGPTARDRAQGAWPLAFLVKPVDLATFRRVIKSAEDTLGMGTRFARYRTPVSILDGVLASDQTSAPDRRCLIESDPDAVDPFEQAGRRRSRDACDAACECL